MRSQKRGDYVGLYGNVRIPKSWCQNCQSASFVFDNKLVCCGTPVEFIPERYKRESEPEQKRRTLTLKERQKQLEGQDYKCFYCERTFGSAVFRKGRSIKLRIHYDHMVPYSFSQNNKSSNFVAACHICNSIKSDFFFQTVEEAQIFIRQRWEEKGLV